MTHVCSVCKIKVQNEQWCDTCKRCESCCECTPQHD